MCQGPAIEIYQSNENLTIKFRQIKVLKILTKLNIDNHCRRRHHI